MAYSKQNFQDGQILTAANLEKMENGIIAGQGARNLLDNSDFTNPVNQRGQSSYSGTGGKVYTIDRWHTWSASISVSVQSGYLSITNSTDSIYQNISQIIAEHNLTDKAATIAVWDAAGNVYCASGVMSTNNNEITCNTPTDFWFSAILEDDNTIYFAIRPRGAKTAKIKAAALYEGSYTADTLPDYVPKGKHVEMINCGVPLAPHNLLDNSNFRNPVNQRGITSQIGGGYGLDRWRADGSGTISVESTGISLTNLSFRQPVPLKAGTYTLAFHLSDGRTLGYVFKFDGSSTLNAINSSWNETTGAYVNYYKHATGVVMVQIVVAEGYTIIVDWAALYEGSYTADTLPAYQPKGYAAELAECQRYYRRFINSAPAMSISATAIEAEMVLEPPMRVVPTITINSVGHAYTPEGTKSVSGSYSATNTVNKAGYVFYTPSVGIGLSCVITGIDGYLSADL